MSKVMVANSSAMTQKPAICYGNTTIQKAAVDTSWGLMPIFISAIADGKVYAFNNEHSPNSPLYNGYNIYCLNATTGEEIYKMLSWSGQTGGAGANTAILADGSLVYYNYYDNQLYCISKGPTKTTVMRSKLAAASGQSVVISGTVMDISSGTTQNEQAARFPNGVAAASDESTSAWMEYVYMDQIKTNQLHRRSSGNQRNRRKRQLPHHRHNNH